MSKPPKSILLVALLTAATFAAADKYGLDEVLADNGAVSDRAVIAVIEWIVGGAAVGGLFALVRNRLNDQDHQVDVFSVALIGAFAGLFVFGPLSAMLR